MKRVLVGVDGSELSLHAVRRAAELARAIAARLDLVYVAAPVRLPQPTYAKLIHEVEEQERAFADQALARAEAEAKALGATCSKIATFGEPTEVLESLARADEVDTVVVATHGRGAMGRLMLGSVADHLVHLCTKPVLVVR
jgi:nucleotide-binding universal stress UspA family protein